MRRPAYAALAIAALSPAPLLAQDAFGACLSAAAADAAAQGAPRAVVDAALAGVTADPSILEFLSRQPEFTTPIWDYLAGLVDEERVADGRARMEQWAEVLKSVEAAYGVDAATVVAVWGVESDFGRIQGRRPLVQSLGSLACLPNRRQAFFRGELIATLRLLGRGDVSPDQLTGSWAGAFGQTQFMPTTYWRIAVDHDGDGRRDLVGSTPDALASTANYLRRAGWRTGEPWGVEVALPSGFDLSGAGRRAKRPLAAWAAAGVRQADGAALSGERMAGLVAPAGPRGPAFLTFANFDAIYAYNAAESYALAIATLADRLRGGSGLRTPWPTDDPGLSRAERREVQTLLLARGHDIGAPDGLIGARTRVALSQEQARLGLPADGRAGRRILEALRAAP